MDCRELRNQIESLSLVSPLKLGIDELEHLQSCAECQEEFHQCQEAWLLLQSDLPKTAVSESLEEQVMQRIAAAPQPRREYSQRAIFWKYAVAASLLLLATCATLFRLGVLGPDESTLADKEIAGIKSIVEQMGKLDELERVFAAPNLRYVSLESTEPTSPNGYLVQDPMSQQAHFFGSDLQVQPETELCVWLLDENDALLATATIQVQTESGLGTALLNLEPNSVVKSAMITEETKGSSPAMPSQRVLLRSNVTHSH